MITKEHLEEYIRSTEVISDEAEKILHQIDSSVPIEGFQYLEIVGIGEIIVFEGIERWGYGGNETYRFSFDSNFLYDPVALNDYIVESKFMLEARIAEKEHREKYRKDQEIQARRDQYTELKKEFG